MSKFQLSSISQKDQDTRATSGLREGEGFHVGSNAYECSFSENSAQSKPSTMMPTAFQQSKGISFAQSQVSSEYVSDESYHSPFRRHR